MTIKPIAICFLLSVVFPLFCFGQNQEKIKTKQSVFSQLIHHDRIALKLNYFGELVLHPGLTVGIDYTVKKKNWVTIHWDTDLGGFHHHWNNTSLFLKSSIGSRFPIRSIFIDLNLGIGYMHSFVAVDVYQKSENGGIERIRNWGHGHFMPNSSFLIGWDGTRNLNRPWTFHIGAEAYLQSAFNHIFLPHVAAKIGFTYKLKKYSK